MAASRGELQSLHWAAWVVHRKREIGSVMYFSRKRFISRVVSGAVKSNKHYRIESSAFLVEEDLLKNL